MIVEGGMEGEQWRGSEGDGERQVGKGEQGSLSSMRTERGGGAILILLGSNRLSAGVGGAFPVRWPVYIGLIILIWRSPRRAPPNPSPFYFKCLRLHPHLPLRALNFHSLCKVTFCCCGCFSLAR